MHITRVELENIKSYERGDFAFERGSTAIVGPNGAGKTTILEAVAWTLFDVLDYSKDDFLRRGSKRGWVRVTFQSDLDERQYTVYRDTATGFYVYDPELKVKLQQGKADVRKFLEQHLGTEPGTDLKSLFRSAIGVPQGLFTTDFLRSPADRKAAFDRLLKVEEYRESADRLRDTLHLIDKRIAEAKVRISGAESQLSRYDETVAEQRSALARVEELEKKLADGEGEFQLRTRAVAELDALEKRVNESRTARERFDVANEAAHRRLHDLRNELLVAESAAERARATEADHLAYLNADEGLRALEKDRAERDQLRESAAELARRTALAEGSARSAAEALERATRAREELTLIGSEVARQEALERERELLRERLAQARAAAEQLGRVERERETLKKQYNETRRRVRAAESLKGAPERVAKLESERHGMEMRLSEVERSLTSRGHLVKQQRELSREIERLRNSVMALERESRELEQLIEKLTAEEGGPAALEERERELVQAAAALRAVIEREERIREETKGGVCPILGDRCTSFSEGQTFETYFGAQLKANRDQLSFVESEGAAVQKSLAAAREGERNAARVDATRSRLSREAELSRDREAALARIDQELAALPRATEEMRAQIQADLKELNDALIAARADALRFAELENLHARLKEIEDEGKAKTEERERLLAISAADEALTKEIQQLEDSLRLLNDPRGRAAVLRADAKRESTLRSETETARQALLALETQQREVGSKLMLFEQFDVRWREASSRRDATSAAHREYLESTAIAKMLPDRKREARKAEQAASEAARNLMASRAEYEGAQRVYDPAQHAKEREASVLVGQRIADLTARLEAAREKESELREAIARLDEVRQVFHDQHRAKQRLEEVFEATDFIRDTLKKAGPLVTESYLYNISIEANQLFREITGEGGRALRWTKEYEIMLEEDGYDLSFVNLSGGEQMAAALSVRLALLKQLSDIRLAFFDEPTINMDSDNRARLANQLGQVRNLDQLFVISHDDTFEESVDHVLAIRASEAA
jgi:exonuclease SbcC